MVTWYMEIRIKTTNFLTSFTPHLMVAAGIYNLCSKPHKHCFILREYKMCKLTRKYRTREWEKEQLNRKMIGWRLNGEVMYLPSASLAHSRITKHRLLLRISLQKTIFRLRTSRKQYQFALWAKMCAQLVLCTNSQRFLWHRCQIANLIEMGCFRWEVTVVRICEWICACSIVYVTQLVRTCVRAYLISIPISSGSAELSQRLLAENHSHHTHLSGGALFLTTG